MKARTILWILCAFAVEASLLALANWQFHRMAEKEALALVQQQRAPDTRSGTWQVSATVALDNQPRPGNGDVVGWRIFTPLDVSGDTVLVDRGWVPLPPDRTAVPDFAGLAPTTTTVSGVWAAFPQRHGWLPGPDTTTNSRVLAWLNSALITSASTGPAYLQATTATAPGVLAMPPSPPSGQRHAAYALQWLLMALVFPILCIVAYRRRR